MSTDKLSPCQNNMVWSGVRENIILSKIILTIGGTNGYVKGDTWCYRGG